MKSIWIVLALSLACFAQSELPDGAGKASVVKVCTSCHGLDTVTSERRTKSEWDTEIDEMAARGATGTDDEFDAVMQYLTHHFGKVNVNQAPADEIQDMLEVPESASKAIVDYRTKNGSFKDLTALEKVPGVDAKVLEQRKERIAFE